jgi:hypothetical protein
MMEQRDAEARRSDAARRAEEDRALARARADMEAGRAAEKAKRAAEATRLARVKAENDAIKVAKAERKRADEEETKKLQARAPCCRRSVRGWTMCGSVCVHACVKSNVCA